MQVRLGHVSEHLSQWPGAPTSVFLPNRYTFHIETWPIWKGLKSSPRSAYKIVWGMCLAIPVSGLGGPTSESLPNCYTSHIETCAIWKGTKNNPRQVHQLGLGMCQGMAGRDQLANFYQTLTPVILKPGPSERASIVMLVRHTKSCV
jgi:hypothetical protein